MRGAWRELLAGNGSQSDADIVWADLTDFCMGERTTAVENDPVGRQMAQHEGRRDVLNRIRETMAWSERELTVHVQSGRRALGVESK